MKKRLTVKKVIVLILSLIFIVGFVRQYQTMNRIEKEKETKQQQLEQLKEQHERLAEENNKAQSDEYLEELARERLNMLKPGESSVEIKKVDSDS